MTTMNSMSFSLYGGEVFKKSRAKEEEKHGIHGRHGSRNGRMRHLNTKREDGDGDGPAKEGEITASKGNLD